MLRFASMVVFGFFASSAGAATVLLNEFQPNPPGGDPGTQQIELIGTPGESFSGSLVSVETDQNGSDLNQVQDIDAISGTFDANGLFTLGIDDLENPSFLLALVGQDFTLSIGDFVDANNDGNIDDISAFGTVFDAISLADQAGDEVDFASELGGTDFSFVGVGAFNDEPELIFRDSITLALFAVNDLVDDSVAFNPPGEAVSFSEFNFAPNAPTFGAVNATVVPLPPTALLFVSALVAGFAFRQRR